jgi:hypothetical protein
MLSPIKDSDWSSNSLTLLLGIKIATLKSFPTVCRIQKELTGQDSTQILIKQLKLSSMILTIKLMLGLAGIIKQLSMDLSITKLKKLKLKLQGLIMEKKIEKEKKWPGHAAWIGDNVLHHQTACQLDHKSWDIVHTSIPLTRELEISNKRWAIQLSRSKRLRDS